LINDAITTIRPSKPPGINSAVFLYSYAALNRSLKSIMIQEVFHKPEKSVEKIRLEDAYVTRFGERIYWKVMQPEERDCIGRAVDFYNTDPGHLAFIDWMIGQPEIMNLFRCYGLRLKRVGRRSKMYEICTDLLFRITRSEGITGRIQNTPLQ